MYSAIHQIIEWNKTFGKGGLCMGRKAQQTSDNGFIIFSSEYWGDWGGIEGIWLIKTDNNGNIEWDKSYGGSERDVFRDGFITNDDGYIITGTSYSYREDINHSLWLLKLDEDGVIQWSKILEGHHDSYIAPAKDEGYVLSTKIYEDDNFDVVLIKVDNSGNELWRKRFGGNENDVVVSVESTNDDGFILAGYTFLSNAEFHSPWLVKTDANGNVEWEKIFGIQPPDYHCYANSAQQTSDGGYIVIGQMGGELTGWGDVWLVKTDGNGDIIWENTFEMPHDIFILGEAGYDVKETMDNGFIIACEAGNIGGLWIIKTNSNGNKLWDISLDELGAFSLPSIQQTIDGGYIITASYELGNFLSDVWLIKLEADVPSDNSPPEKPEPPIGPTEGGINQQHDYSASATDPDGDQLYYKWDWGDGEISDWYGPRNSGDTITTSHGWDSRGEYNVRVKVKDAYGFETTWSDPLSITMPKVKTFDNIPKIILWLFEYFSFLQPYFSYFL